MCAQVFIAYSKDDAAWRKRLTTMLAPLVRVGLSSWDETHIQPGQSRQPAIEAAIAGASVAVLLVSAGFLATEFLGQELSDMLATAHRDKRLRILWVAVRPSLWHETVLTAYESVHDSDNPLSTLSDADTALAQICTRIKEAVAPAPAFVGEALRRNPYRGLCSFEVEESHLFFGREEVTQQLCKNFQLLCDKPGVTRLLSVLGPSGSGKSSVARAGLMAALQRSSVAGAKPLRTVILKPGPRPIESLARALVPLLPPETAVLPASQAFAIEELLRSSAARPQGLRRFADDLPQIDHCPLLLLVDQFEEIYTLCTDQDERDAFVSLLLHAASERTRHVAVVLTLRSDFLGDTQRYHSLLNRLIAAQAVIVPAMSPEELRAAIAKPAEQAGRPIDQATVELLLAEARGSQGALPLLEFALMEIWEGMLAGNEPGATLREIGGIGGALAGKAQEIYGTLTEHEQTIAQRALVRLVQLGEGTCDTRRRAPIRELCGRSETEADVLAVLRMFATESARLVTLSGDGVETMAEVTHEALFDYWTELRDWIEKSRPDRCFHDRAEAAARRWSESQRPPGSLWRPPELFQLADYAERQPDEISDQQAAFLHASQRAYRRSRQFALAALVTVTLSVVCGLSLGLWQQRQRTREAEAAEERIHQQFLSTYVEKGRVLLVEGGRPIEALLWLSKAYSEGATDPSLKFLLRQAMFSVDAMGPVLLHSGGQPSFSFDGRRVLTATEIRLSLGETITNGTAREWAVDSGQVLATLRGHKSNVNNASYSSDDHRIVTAGDDRTARIWETRTGRLLTTLQDPERPLWAAMFDPDGQRVVTVGSPDVVRLWDVTSGRLLVTLQEHRGGVTSIDLSPDGRRIVTSSADRTARVWEMQTGHLNTILQGHQDSVTSAEFCPDGRHVVTASQDKTARVWDTETGHLLATLLGHQDSVETAMFSPDGRHVVTASQDDSLDI